MAVTLFATGTQTATVTTEHFLSSPNVTGRFELQVDLINMAAGDVVELRAYKMVLASGTQRVVFYTSFSGVQNADALIALSNDIANTLTDTNAVRFSLKQTFGTGRNFPWAVLNIEDNSYEALRIGTAQAGASTSITLDSGASSVTDFYKGSQVSIMYGTGANQSNRVITAYNGTTKVATVTPAWATNPDSTSVFGIIPAAADIQTIAGVIQTGRDIGASVLLSSGTGTGQLDFTSGIVKSNETQLLGTAISTPATAGILDVNVKNIKNATTVGTAGYVGIDWAQISAPTTTQGLTNTTISTSQVVASVTGAVGSVTGAVGSVTGNVGGNVVGSVGSVTGAVGSVTAPVTIAASQILIKKNVAFPNFEFLMTSSTTHNPLTGLTVTATRSIDGAAFAACANAVVEVAFGIYKIDLAATDTNGVDITFRFTATAADDQFVTIVTQT